MKQVLKKIKNNQHIRFTKEASSMTELMTQYCSFYNLPTEDVIYSYGFESVGNEKLFIQSFRPLQMKAHILLLHGYFDHTGVLSKVIRYLVQRGFHVLTFDLPGHGLSTGERAAISDFAVYSETIRVVVNRHLSSESFPVNIIAHSTGAAAAIDYLLKNNESSFIQKAVFICPLIRSYRWTVTTIGIRPLKLFTRQMRRAFRKNSSDSQFLHFVKQDPLQYDKIPLHWVEALVKWNKSIMAYGTSTIPTLILQGKKDTTVDWKFNVKFIFNKFLNTNVELIDNGRHHLLNEEERIRERVFATIHQFLTKDQ